MDQRAAVWRAPGPRVRRVRARGIADFVNPPAQPCCMYCIVWEPLGVCSHCSSRSVCVCVRASGPSLCRLHACAVCDDTPRRYGLGLASDRPQNSSTILARSRPEIAQSIITRSMAGGHSPYGDRPSFLGPVFAVCPRARGSGSED